MQLLDYYKSRFGQAVKRQGNGFNGPCPLCGGEPGKSDRFMVWPQRGDHLGDACAKNGILGIWSCRQCGESGDTIAYLTKIENMSFKEALGELGITPAKLPYRRRKAPPEPVSAAVWQPRDEAEPSAPWQEKAGQLVNKAAETIWDCPQAVQWLAARGIDEAAIRAYRIGYLREESEKYHGRFRPRQAFGLAAKTGSDGKVRDKLFIPRGIVIPTFGAAGKILNVRIRRHKADLQERAPKYMELEGSSRSGFFLRSAQPGHLAAYFVVEAELDAMLIHHVSGGVAGALAVRTNRGKPDARSHAALKSSVRVGIALDYDEAGAAGVNFWEEQYANAMRWPTPEGKDPGDAFALGVDIREWIAAALPASVSLPDSDTAPRRGSITQITLENQGIGVNGRVDTSLAGQNFGGKGASPEFGKQASGNGRSDAGPGSNHDAPQENTPDLPPVSENAAESISNSDFAKQCDLWPSEARSEVHERALADDYKREWFRWDTTQPDPRPWAAEADFTPGELASLNRALPKDTTLGMILLDVAVIWLLWRKLPITFVQNRDELGNCTGFKWEYDYDYAAQHERQFELFWRLQATSRAFWTWLADHPANRITPRNLLHLYELQAQL